MDIRAITSLAPVAGSQPAAREAAAAPGVQAVLPPAPVQPERPVARDPDRTREMVSEQLGNYLRSAERDLEFHVDGATQATVITVRDGVSGDLVRQIPNETALRIMRLLNAESGTLMNLTA